MEDRTDRTAPVIPPPAARLSRKTKIGFGIGDLGGNLFFTVMGSYTLYYLTDNVGLTAALAGLAILIGKIWDAINDPLMGYFIKEFEVTLIAMDKDGKRLA